MRIHPIPFTIFLCLFSIFSFSQKDTSYALQLRSGKIFTEKNITQEKVKTFTAQLQKINGKSFAVLQFEQLPSETKKQELAASGIQLLEYISGNAYTICITKNIDYSILQKAGARSIFELLPVQKMHPTMAKGIFPSWAIKTPGMVDVWISFPKTLSFEELQKLLSERNFQITTTDYKEFHVVGLEIAISRINDLASLPFVDYIEPTPHKAQMLNYESRNDSRANILNAASSVGGYDLKGEGIVVGIGDNADVQYHVDFTGRLINFSTATVAYHGSHVHGTVAGGGILMEEFRGYAPKATIVSQEISGILKNAPVYVNDYGMVITNNSYTSVVGDCDYAGTYDLESRVLDLMALSYPQLQNVFAAGNDGGLTCSPFPGSFKTVVGGFQTAKNGIVVGATNRDGSIASFSSRGPVKDGRIKPEVTADGVYTTSTIYTYGYGVSPGTSMSSPAVAGGLVLLNQRYKQIFSVNPKSGLMKALVCNGATDQGNSGPDFTNGFGSMNLLRSIDMLNKSRYFISTVNNAGINTHNISVPVGTAQLKVMLYWHDPAAAVFASQTLVNNLDLDITSPSNVLPFLLDTIPGHVNNTASPGVDHINNIEQAIITNPAAGTYTIRIQGTNVPVSSQEYFVVYDIIPVETKIVFPIGGEGLKLGETATIQWESYGDPANTFTVEYSIDNGTSWATINNSVAANLRQLSWTVPNVQTQEAKVRVTRNGTGYISTSSAFTILEIPVISLSATQCEGYFSIDWAAITGATDYELFMLKGSEMVSVGTTTALTYTFTGLSPDSVYWVSVRARINGGAGRRAVAINRQPNNGTCSGVISDNDLRMDSVIAPPSGRLLTSTALTNNTSVIARIKNLDDADIPNFKLRYYVGGSLIVEDIVGPITAGSTFTHTFSIPYDFSVAGNYILKVEVENISGVDPVPVNNIIIDTIRQLSNDPIILPFTDDLETAVSRKYYKARFGVQGVERYDYTNTYFPGRLSTFLSSGMAYSGTKSLLIDLDAYLASGNTNFIYGTYNLEGVDAVARDIRLDFQLKMHGDSVASADNRVWIRGSDSQTWIEAFVLSANGNIRGIFKKTPSLEIGRLLQSHGQNFSSSFQVRWGQFAYSRINDNELYQGHNIDDIRIYEAIDDIQLKIIGEPLTNKCSLSNAETVKVTIRNASTNSISNIPIRMVVDGGMPVIETITTPLAPNASMQYTFTAKADLSAFGDHTILINVQYGTDNFRDNDTLTLYIFNAPLITTFPHIENFETNNGYWRSSGINNSWEYGVPVAKKINKAASGTKAWKTSLTGNYKNNEKSYLYSPCYNIGGMTNPTLSLNIALDLENCGSTLCDGVYIEYSGDGNTWSRLGNVGTGTNWYNRAYGSGGGNKLWSVQDYTRWHVATTPLPTGVPTIRFRIVLVSDPFVNFEGVAIDDVHVYDNTMGVYDGVTMASPVSQNITGGTAWINFVSGGKLVASIQPNNQNLGITNVQAYIKTGGVRYDGKQYYHDRSITIKPTNISLSDSVNVRFYFLDTETENLLKATGCASCAKPSMVTELGVTKYSDADDNFENGNLADDIQGAFNFLSADLNYKIPFDKGYYVQFKTKDFSEFWLNNGALDRQTALSGMIGSFTAQRKDNNDVLVEWKTFSEQNIDHFEIEVAKGDINFQNNNFEKIGQVTSPGNSNSERPYNFTDNEAGKMAIRYYRLKIVYKDNTYIYSPVRLVVFNDDIQWQIYPNPSNGEYKFLYNLTQNESMNVKIYDVSGRLVKEMKLIGNGYVEQSMIDLRSVKFPSGIYLFSAVAGEKKFSIKLIKH